MGLLDLFRPGKPDAVVATAPAATPVDPVPPQSDPDPVLHSGLVWSLNRPPIKAAPILGRSPQPGEVADTELVARVQAAYRAAIRTFEASDAYWDTYFNEIRKPVHDALVGPEPATDMLRDPARTSHFWGFDAVCKAPEGKVEPHELVMRNMGSGDNWTDFYGRWLHDALVSLAEAVGASRTFYPETTPGYHYGLYGEPAAVDQLLDGIEEAIGKPIRFPNPFADEFGLLTSRGIASYRSIQAAYQAWRLLQLANGRPGFRVIEIGAGLGRTAYFAAQFGLRDYTIVDIPLTNAAQGYFLGRTLGVDQVSLFAEDGGTAVRILPPQAIKGMTETFDLLLNVDSLTEMAADFQAGYWSFARSNTDAMLSINHELNPNTVRSLYRSDTSVRATRHPYWMRRGYVEEHLTWPHRTTRPRR